MFKSINEKSIICKNCGTWIFEKEAKEFKLEKKLKEIFILLNKRDDEVDLNELRKIVGEV